MLLLNAARVTVRSIGLTLLLAGVKVSFSVYWRLYVLCGVWCVVYFCFSNCYCHCLSDFLSLAFSLPLICLVGLLRN